MINFAENNLAKSKSLYLKQHSDNPIHWQEWTPEVIKHATTTGKPVFVSIGYSACHWCHVMSEEAFSNQEVAAYLNENFISIKVDREERPDIDQFAMAFINETIGTGGWPLNIFLTPDLKPFFAGTYFPLSKTDEIPGFLDVLHRLHEWYRDHKESIQPYIPERATEQELVAADDLAKLIKNNFDYQFGGFGYKTKFPPHNTLLYALYYYQVYKDPEIKRIILKTLDAMAIGGLHDHLAGGFFRYCIDREWTIPHFEKMIYDQAMLLWVFSTSYKVFGRDEDKIVANKIIECLDDDFTVDGVFISGIDADTNHVEGATYLWTKNQLSSTLGAKYKQFQKLYDIEIAQVEGKIHLLKRKNDYEPSLERRLLEKRRQRQQPESDTKVVTSWNCLVAISLIQAYRNLGQTKLRDKAFATYRKLLELNTTNQIVYRTDSKKDAGFLEDYAALVLLESYLFEEQLIPKETLMSRRKQLNKFKKDDQWNANVFTKDFLTIPAEAYDHPIPSALALAEYAEARAAILTNIDRTSIHFKAAFHHDFHNVVALLATSSLEVHTPIEIGWHELPLQVIRIKDSNFQVCKFNLCHPFKSLSELKSHLAKYD